MSPIPSILLTCNVRAEERLNTLVNLSYAYIKTAYLECKQQQRVTRLPTQERLMSQLAVAGVSLAFI
jgi:hypothetical protein